MTKLFKPLLQEIEKCSYCGFCKEKCPIYLETRNETYSPRGLLVLLNSLGTNLMMHEEKLVHYLNSCVDCGFCYERCPALVAIEKIFYLSKHQICFSYIPEKEKKLDFIENHMTDKNDFKSYMRKYKMLNFMHTTFLIPKFVKEFLFNSKPGEIPLHKSVEFHNTEKKRRGRVAVLADFLSVYFYPEIFNSTVYLLSKMGYDVYMPAQQMIGVEIAKEYYQLDLMNKIISHNISIIKNAEIDYIVTTSPEIKYIYNNFTKVLKSVDGWLTDVFINEMPYIFDIPEFMNTVKIPYLEKQQFSHSLFVEFSKKGNSETNIKFHDTLLSSIPSIESSNDIQNEEKSNFSLDNGNLIEISNMQKTLMFKRAKEIILTRKYDYIVSDSPKTVYFLKDYLQKDHNFPKMPEVIHLNMLLDRVLT